MDSAPVHSLLQDLGILYETVNHPPVYTVEEAKQHREGMQDATHAKNLFLKDSKTKQFYLFSLQADRQIRLKELKNLVGAKKMSFASEEQLDDILGLEAGSVSPFGLLNDIDNQVIYVVDPVIWNADKVAFHPNENTSTLVLSGAEFQQVIQHLVDNPIILQVDK